MITSWKTPPARRNPVLPLASHWTPVKCKWCDVILAEVQGPATLRVRCPDRGCRMWNEISV